MISEQIEQLEALKTAMQLDVDMGRVKAKSSISERIKVIDDAIDTIRTLSEKLQTANMERSTAYYNSGWIPISESLPDDKETVICTDGAYMYIVEYHADWDAPFADLDGIKAWMYAPEIYKG